MGHLSNEGRQRLLANPDMFLEVCREVKVAGTQLLARYAVIGRYDFIVMAEATTPEAVARLSLELGARAKVHIETLLAISVGILGEPSERVIPEFLAAAEAPEER